MPYIKEDLREQLKFSLDLLAGDITTNIENFPENRAGVLNYVITSLIDSCYGPLANAKYQDYNEAIGMLECCKLEFYRKAVTPYEDIKLKENGPVLDGGNGGVRDRNNSGIKRTQPISNKIVDKNKTYKLHKNIKKNQSVLFGPEDDIVKDKR